MAESQPVEDGDKGKRKGKKNRKVGYLKMQVIDDLKAETIQGVVSGEVDPASKIDSDDSSSYKGLEKWLPHIAPKSYPKRESGKLFHGYILQSAMLKGCFWTYTMILTVNIYRTT